jgi:DNA topoisomerase-3
LFIAEKPSMAAEIAKILFNTSNPDKKLSHFSGTGSDKVTWLFGHVLELAEPGGYKEEWVKWNLDALPIIPENWRRLVKNSAQKQFDEVKKLIGEASEIVHAGDPDREGQLLVDEVLDYLGNKKPVKRLLLNSLDAQSIKKALTGLYDNSQFSGLSASADLRAKLDWLIGMNATRAVTLKARASGYNRTFSIGRVRTPTLILAVKREEEIKKFKPVEYYPVTISCRSGAGFFQAKLEPEKLPPELIPGIDGEGRLIDQAIANRIAANIDGDKHVKFVVGKSEEKTEPPPLPFSLSALQIQASKQYGLKAQAVLDICQTLYEAKLITYPRSDCPYLPTSQYDDSKTIINNLKNSSKPINRWAASADCSLKSRVWNDGKITAHHAIIPTLLSCDPDKLAEDEKKIYTLVAQNYLAQFYPAYRYKEIRAELIASGYPFTVSGRNVIEEGWKTLYTKETTDEEIETIQSIPELTEESDISLIKAGVSKEKTAAPSRYTEGTLLAAMKNIYKHVYNADLRNTLKETGLGTEATRAGILKSLVDENYLYEEGKKKYLVPTQEAYLLYGALPAQLTYPDYTAMMERELEMIAENKIGADVVLAKDAENIKTLCGTLKTVNFQIPENRKCPRCDGGTLLQRKDAKGGAFWGCNKYPDCKATFPDKNGEPDLTPKETISCPVCKQGFLRLNNKLKFWGCTKYPDCKATFPDRRGKPQIILCPECKKGYLKLSGDKDKKHWYCARHKEGCKAVFPDKKGQPDGIKP